MLNILIVEDDVNQLKIMSAFLRSYGYQTIPAADGEAALKILETEHVDMVISDIMMPKMDGYELTRQLRRYAPRLPILMVTAKGDFSDKQLGFLAGTDDYMVKPVDLDEMLLRVKALFRRADINSAQVVRAGEVEVDSRDWTVRGGGLNLSLPKKEFLLLYTLLSYPGRIFTRSQLMDTVWGPDCETDERTVDVHIKRLREKLGERSEFRIATIRGLGYRAEVADA